MENQINRRIALLRDFLKLNNLQAFIIPSTDAHLSEYIPEHWEARHWISGFSGSAGIVVVTLLKTGLWTDSRYFLQAENELAGSEILLFKDRLPETESIPDWLKSELSAGSRVGVDGNVYAAKDFLRLKRELKTADLELVSDFDPFETIWKDHPALPGNQIFILPVEITGESAGQKMERVLAETEKNGGDSIWISTLDAVAWLFNLRGCDVSYNPVFVAHAFVSRNERLLFIHPEKITPEVAGYLKEENVEIRDYCDVDKFLTNLSGFSVCIDSSRLSYRIYRKMEEQNRLVDILSVTDVFKSMKNKTEADGFRRVMIRDGVALTRFFIWLEKTIPEGRVTEYNIGLKLKEFRSKQESFVGESFGTIAGYASNGAVVHYHPEESDCQTVKPEGFLLIDSGGQYQDGTTDITRTVAVGPVSDQMKKDYTLVLKGMIDLSMVVFPAGTRGSQIDILARKPMWEYGVNYLHGTGHGVGHFLNVHEGPHSIRQEENPVAMRIGMVVTNEPGIYRDHAYGIRTENMMLTKLAMSTDYGDFYNFETLTWCPIDTTPIVTEMMTAEEISWLNEYHRQVYEKLSPYLSDEENRWLKNKTAAIGKKKEGEVKNECK